eukprot:scaffold3361_cov243-Chaetoceros_neogracile.AAC.2
MRKAAFQIMSKTFGTKRKDTGQGYYDHYPLNDLVHLLCFEDLAEAKSACEFYNITVSSMKIRENPDEFEDYVFWRSTSFKEPRDPEKGNILSLKPRKMNRIIESKLGGVTRLAICRGEVSGAGASLDSAICPENAKRLEEMAKQREHLLIKRQEALHAAKRNELKMKLKMEQIREAKEQKARAENEREDEIARKKAAEEATQKRNHELRLQKKLDEEESQRKQEAERLAYKSAMEVARFKKMKEECQKLEQLEEEKRRQKEEEEERQRHLEEKRLLEESERQKWLRREAEEILYQKRVAERQRLLEIKKRDQEEIDRKREEKEAEETRIELEWQRKIALARKLLVLNAWSARMSAVRDRREDTKASIECFDPFMFSSIDFHSVSKHIDLPQQTDTKLLLEDAPSFKSMLYQLGTDAMSPLPLHAIFFDLMTAAGTFHTMSQMKLQEGMSKNIVLFKMGVVVVAEGLHDDTKDFMRMWINNRLQLECVRSQHAGLNEVRTVCSFYDSTNIASQECDGLLIMVAPGTVSKEHLDGILSHVIHFDMVTNPCDFDQILLNGCKNLASSFVSTFKAPSNSPLLGMEFFSLRWLYCAVLRRTLCSFSVGLDSVHQLPSHLQRSEIEGCVGRLVIHCFEVLIYLVENMYSLSNDGLCAASNFVVDTEVQSYFNEKDGLPVNWRTNVELSNLQEAMWDIFPSLSTQNYPSFLDLLRDLIEGAPLSVQHDCGALLNTNKFVECLDVGLQWQTITQSDISRDYCVYLPIGGARALIDFYLDHTMSPKAVVTKKVNNCYVAESVCGEPPLVRDGDGDSMELPSIEENSAVDANGNMVHNKTEFDAHPKASNKRSFLNNSTLDRKKSKVISEELQSSRVFTESLKTMCSDNADLGGILNDPHFAKLIAKDATLQKLLNM